MKYVYRVEFNLTCDLNKDEERRWPGNSTQIVKKIVAEDHRDVISKIDKLFKTWWDDPKTLSTEDVYFSDKTVFPHTYDITKLERGSQIDIE